MMVSFFINYYLNKLANRFLGDTSLLLFIFSNLNSPIQSDDHIFLIQCHRFKNGLAIVSLAFLNKLHQVPRSVSAAHSTAIKGVANNEAGAFQSFWYHFQFVKALCTASLMLDAVFPIHSTGSNTQYNAVCVASESVYNHVQRVERGTTHTVFPIALKNFHIFMAFVTKVLIL